MNLQRLKQETEADHQTAEDALPLMQAHLDRAQYIRYLSRLYQLFAAWEETAPASAPRWLRTLLIQRRRKPLLQQDLAWFSIAEPLSRAALPPIRNLPHLLGAMYVIEGSTLGGQIIARHVAQALPLTHGHGDAFFRGHGIQTGPLWKEFCLMLTTTIPDDQTATVIVSAKAMFAAFTHSMQEKSAMNGG